MWLYNSISDISIVVVVVVVRETAAVRLLLLYDEGQDTTFKGSFTPNALRCVTACAGLIKFKYMESDVLVLVV